MSKIIFNIVIPLSVILITITASYGQSVIVYDPFVMSTLVVCHTDQQAELKNIKQQETQITILQGFITAKMEEIKEIEKKMHNRLKTISAVVKDGKNIVYASSIAKDIGKYQSQMLGYAKENPELLIIAYKAEAALVNRTADLFTFIATALIGGDVNLLDNKQRHDLVENVVRELRIMRGLAYSVSRQMRTAAKTGVIKYLNPFHLKYPNRDMSIVQDILKDVKR